MVLKYAAMAALFFISFISVMAQPADDEQKADSSSLLGAFKHGKTEGHFRYFFMATDNKKGLTDYHAHATGGGLRFVSAPFHGFQLGIGGFFIFNTGSSDLLKPDPVTGQLNRYEIGLFDIEHPSNKNDIDRLEELFIRYEWRNQSIKFGKQIINTPFINPQDGRMRPTGVEGVWYQKKSERTQINAGVLWKISPRSTVRWFNVGESIGVYPQGVSESGSPSAYKNNLNSNYVALFGITQKLNNRLKIQLWEQLVDQMFNTVLLQADQDFGSNESAHAYTAVQGIMQQSLKDGGNTSPALTYMQKGSTALSFGVRVGYKNKEEDLSLNYNRITGNGRYLMPREWGRDPFFTFLPRERNEGFGNLNAWMLQYKRKYGKSGLQSQFGLGYYQLPDVLDARLNKYGMPSYTQFNADVQYNFSGALNGAQLQFLYVYKGGNGNTYNNDKYVIHKVNTSLFNLILNYRF